MGNTSITLGSQQRRDADRVTIKVLMPNGFNEPPSASIPSGISRPSSLAVL
jgi:hypothetical protein